VGAGPVVETVADAGGHRTPSRWTRQVARAPRGSGAVTLPGLAAGAARGPPGGWVRGRTEEESRPAQKHPGGSPPVAPPMREAGLPAGTAVKSAQPTADRHLGDFPPHVTVRQPDSTGKRRAPEFWGGNVAALPPVRGTARSRMSGCADATVISGRREVKELAWWRRGHFPCRPVRPSALCCPLAGVAWHPHVRFAEAELEKEHGCAPEAPANERAGNS
jgi:hypothetical protein